MTKLLVSNPSDYFRGGYVSTPWQPIREATGLDPEGLRVVDGQGRPLPSQVDRIDPADPSRDVLTILLTDPLPPGTDDYGQVSAVFELAGGAPAEPGDGPRVEIAGEGVRLANDRMSVWLSLHVHEGKPWFSGAAASVVLDGMEMLDATSSYWGFMVSDLEKRCMQVDRIQVLSPCPPASVQEVSVFDRPYEVISLSTGPVRATVSMATEPFVLDGFDPRLQKCREWRCRLHRVFSLNAGADHLFEEMYLAGIDTEGGKIGEEVGLRFGARYFAFMHLGLFPEVVHFPDSSGWLAIANPFEPNQSYGFAASVPIGPVANPHPGFPLPEHEHKSFSWEIGINGTARCMHLFKRCSGREMAAHVGEAWYQHMFKPLRAIVQMGDSAASGSDAGVVADAGGEASGDTGSRGGRSETAALVVELLRLRGTIDDNLDSLYRQLGAFDGERPASPERDRDFLRSGLGLAHGVLSYGYQGTREALADVVSRVFEPPKVSGPNPVEALLPLILLYISERVWQACARDDERRQPARRILDRVYRIVGMPPLLD